MLAADVLNLVPDADTVASAVITAAASTNLPANELKGAWEKLAIPNINYPYKLFIFAVNACNSASNCSLVGCTTTSIGTSHVTG
jgi:hypothetical protein